MKRCNLLGLKLEERPWIFRTLFDLIRDLRARTGRPHWLLVDEAHHVLPANWEPADEAAPERLSGALMARAVWRALDTLLVDACYTAPAAAGSDPPY